MIGLFIFWTTINFAVWFGLALADFTFKECLIFALGTELFVTGIVAGVYLLMGGI